MSNTNVERDLCQPDSDDPTPESLWLTVRAPVPVVEESGRSEIRLSVWAENALGQRSETTIL